MLLQEDSNESRFRIKRYEPGVITVNDEDHHKSLIISREDLKTDWPPQTLAELAEPHLAAILTLKPEIVLLGTGALFAVPNKAIIRYFHDRKVGFEYMDTGAACRTFLALSSEDRNVVAALLIK